MRRVESDPEELAEIEAALSRAATPTHEQPTEEIDVIAIREALGKEACRGLYPKLRLVERQDPPDLVA